MAVHAAEAGALAMYPAVAALLKLVMPKPKRDFKKELVALYQQYAPERLESVDLDKLLAKWYAREEDLLANIKKKYSAAAAPPPPPAAGAMPPAPP